ncbi:hypothetical protein SK355_05905 [Candidatus Fukatsuia symbiotica]|uniref:hypothetical protein n=1 Tax=Candidatus Fukatsuia symbiotica TaxID=1878942 RepID=UPI0013C3FDB4|nr:hypothetical protein [Candidatus Fukatsuia symbiotica]MEA9444816.1 hypothetical protein [Candidatus Fukatsuia symbiotica]
MSNRQNRARKRELRNKALEVQKKQSKKETLFNRLINWFKKKKSLNVNYLKYILFTRKK